MIKVVTLKENNMSIMIADENTTMELKEDHILKNSIERIYGISSSNCNLYEVEKIPDMWKPHKYYFDGLVWEKNENYKESEENQE